jgi:hypothetical protein
MSEKLGRNSQKSNVVETDESICNYETAASEDDRKPEALVLKNSAPVSNSNSTQSLGTDSECDAPSHDAEPAPSSSCEENSISKKKRKMNVIYSRRKREKKKRVVAELSQKSVEAQRENVRLRIEGQRLEELLRRALKIAAEYERSCLQQPSLASSQQLDAHRNVLPQRTVPSSTLADSQPSHPLIWPPGNLLSQPYSNSTIDAELSRQMAQILAERQSLASMQLNQAASNHMLRIAHGLDHQSAVPSLINPINGLPPGYPMLHDVSALDELIQRKLLQHADSSLLLRQGISNAIHSYPNQINISRMGPSVESIRNMILPLLPANSLAGPNRPGAFPSNQFVHGPPPVSNAQQDIIVNHLVQAHLNDLDQQTRGSTRDDSPQDPSPQKG